MSPSIPALDTDNPYSNAEFVIYSTTEDMVGYDAQTEMGEETGFVGIGLWVRYPDEGIELPVFSQSEQGVWLSLDADQSRNSEDSVVSDAFTKAVGYLTDEDVGDGWCAVRERTWETMPLSERYIVGQLRHTIIHGAPPAEAVLVVEACRERVGGESDE